MKERGPQESAFFVYDNVGLVGCGSPQLATNINPITTMMYGNEYLYRREKRYVQTKLLLMKESNVIYDVFFNL